MNPQQDRPENTNPYHEPRDYKYPDPETNLPPAPAHHLRAAASHKKSKKSRAGIWIAAVIVVMALALAAFFMFFAPKKTFAPTPTNSPATGQAPKKSAPAPAANVLKSTKLALQVTKPAGWQGTEDATTGALTLTSPETSYTSIGSAVKGVFTLTIQQGADTDTQDTIHNTNAIQDSESIAYSAPTDNQFQFTNLTVIGNIDIANYLLLTASDQYKKGEAMARFFVNGDTYVIIGGFHPSDTTKLKDYDGLTPASFLSSPEYKQAVATIQSLKIF